MATTLMTFLGRVPNKEGSYRKTAYQFAGGSVSEPVAFFGWALQQWIAAERVIIMGTAGSMWDHMFEGDIEFEQEAEDARIALIDAARAKAVTVEVLEPLEQPLSNRLGCAVRLVLIPYCRDAREQVELLRIMAGHVEQDDRVHIDVSHGLRHLPMIALLAALHLRVVRNATIGGIWYGAFDPDTDEAPVHDLSGMLHIADWIQALHTYDKDGDYSAFAPLLGPTSDVLAEAAFFERATNPVKAREKLSTWSSRPDRFPPDDPAAELFRSELERRVEWFRENKRHQWEEKLAWRYLEQRDYVRAAIYGLEAVISDQISRSKGKVDNFDQREEVREELRVSREGFRTLSNLRNALAHGVRPEDEKIQRIVAKESTLRNTLKSLLTQLLAFRAQQRA